MARAGKKALIARVVDSLTVGGWTVQQITEAGVHPALLRIRRGRRTLQLRIYIWNLTHGGGAARPKHEFRIQVTSGVLKFRRDEGEQTAILGWSDEFGVFAGFDFLFHVRELGQSPSMQINSAALLRSVEAGIAARTRKNGEIAIAVRPDLLGKYIDDLAAFHKDTTSKKRIEAIQSNVLSDRDTQIRVDISDEVSRIQEIAQSKLSPSYGDENELAQRQTIVERVEALEREIKRFKPADAKMGHNLPPEAMETEAPSAVLDDLTASASALKKELSKPSPDVPEISKHADILRRAAGAFRSLQTEVSKFGEKLKEKAKDKAAEMIIAGGVIALGSIVQNDDVQAAIAATLRSIGLWIRMIF
jgi:hypothetical protein